MKVFRNRTSIEEDSISRHSSLKVAAMLGAVLALAVGCKKKPPTTTPTGRASSFREHGSAAADDAPHRRRPPLARSDGVLSEDLQTLNSKGYLKDAFFDFDRAELREDARTALAADAQWLKRVRLDPGSSSRVTATSGEPKSTTCRSGRSARSSTKGLPRVTRSRGLAHQHRLLRQGAPVLHRPRRELLAARIGAAIS